MSPESRRKLPPNPATLAELCAQLENLIESQLRPPRGIALTALARQAAVSTRTLNEIRGGRLMNAITASQSGNKRKRAAWVRVLANLARYFGRPVSAWVVAAGFSWDEVGHLVSRHGRTIEWIDRRTNASTDRATGVLAQINLRVLNADSYPVKVGVIQYPPFSTPLGIPQDVGGTIAPCFNTIYADRLVGAVEPAWKPHFTETNSLSEHFARLAANELDMVMGVFDTTARRRRGLRFVRIPGWRISLNAAALTNPDDDQRIPEWRQICDPNCQAQFTAVLAADTAEDEYVRGSLRFLPENIVRCPVYDVSRLAATFFATYRDQPESKVVLISDDSTVRLVMRMAIPSDICGKSRWTELGGAPGERPSYAMSIGIPEDSRWQELLYNAQEFELFSRGAPLMANLYSTILLNAAQQYLMDKWTDDMLRVWRVYDDFRNELFSNALKTTLYAKLRTLIADEDSRDRIAAILIN